MRTALIGLVFVGACGTNWTARDVDGDGYTPADGDCWDSLEPLLYEGSKVHAADVHPGAVEVWYDGIDQDCAGDDDFDVDGDGWVTLRGHLNRGTWNSPGSAARHAGAGDCWDALAGSQVPTEFVVVPADVAGVEWLQPLAADVHPGVGSGNDVVSAGAPIDVWYDGVDQNCAGDDDFDADGDGYRTSAHPDADGSVGLDCIDGADGDAANPSGAAAADVNPGAVELWYDGTDDDCDEVSTVDCDQDGDGYRADPNALDDLSLSPCDFADDEPIDCVDVDPDVRPDVTVEEVHYNGSDDNCDVSDGDGDKDGDGFWAADYLERLTSAGLSVDQTVVVPEVLDDCWDDPEVTAADAGQAAGLELRVLDGFSPLTPDEVFPEQRDRPYDGADQDCAGADVNADGISDDFDWDGDGQTSVGWPQRDGVVGGDCLDCPAACLDLDSADPVLAGWCDALCVGEAPNPGAVDPALVYAGAAETWYDGTDQDCDGASDFDADADGYDHLDAGGVDCFEGTDLDDVTNPAGVSPDSIHPDATETWYDGTDQDCDGASDLDADQDGYDHSVFGGGDCVEGTSLDTTANEAGFAPSAIHPGAADVWYDGTDQDCSGESDFDADRDGFDHEAYGGGDCLEATAADTDPNPSGAAAANVRPGVTEVWYDGTDDDCDGNDGDADGDGRLFDGYAFASGDDCDDTDATIYTGAEERVGDEIDQDCDGAEVCYVDLDGDGARPDSATVVASADLDCSDVGEAAASAVAGDCDDADNTVAPGAVERCDGLDNDCNGALAGIERDIDGDGFVACTEDPAGWDAIIPTGFEDCNDFDASVWPGAAELCDGQDNDCDGSIPIDEQDGDGDSHVVCTIDGDGWDGVAVAGGDDCDDTSPTVYVGAPEWIGDEIDQDCNGGELCYVDRDADGFHDGSTTVTSADVDCDDAGEFDQFTPGGDCDDADGSRNPSAVEGIADEIDQDCDGGEICYLDGDGDGFRPDATSTVTSGDSDCGDVGEALGDAPTTDCDDADAAVNPAAVEVCDAGNVDEDCNGVADDADSGVDPTTTGSWFPDADGDSYGDESAVVLRVCDDPSSGSLSYVEDSQDCDDTDSTINPAGRELCDEFDVDEDCDGLADDLDSSTDTAAMLDWFVDADVDGFGDPTLTTVLACDDPSDSGTQYSLVSDDCDDGDGDVFPGAAEAVGDGVDGDCDGSELCFVDADDDGYRASAAATVLSVDTDCVDSGEAEPADPLGDCDDADPAVSPDAVEVCDAVDLDEDCNGVADDADAGVDASTQTSWVPDVDGDGYGDSSAVATLACEAPSTGSFVVDASDCDDGDAAVSPAAIEICSDGVDNDCDGGAGDCTPSDDLDFDADSDGRWLGVSALDGAGRGLTVLDDVTGDGVADIAIGAPGVDVSGLSGAGAAYLVSGVVSGDVSLATAAVVSGSTAGDGMGTVIASEDMDADGFADLLLGVPLNGSMHDGAVYMLTGPISGARDLSAYDARLTGALTGEGLGNSMVGMGDALGFGVGAVLVGAPDSSLSGAGAGLAYVVVGPISGDASVSSHAVVLAYGEAAGDGAGETVASVGDLTGDGIEEFAIGAAGHDTRGADAGRVYIYSGPTTGLVSLADADIVVDGDAAGDGAGTAISGAGDLDADGLDDILIGAPGHDTAGSDSGAAYLLAGSSTMAGSWTLDADGVRLLGETAGENAGASVSAAGDVDLDGFNDVLIGGPASAAGGSGAGVAWLVLGPITADVSLDSAQASVYGGNAGDAVGTVVSAAGDLDGDGSGDLLISSPGSDAAASGGGAVGLILGGGL